MAMNQLRKDPITGKWAIISHEQAVLQDLVAKKQKRRVETEEQVRSCPFCEGNENQTPAEIWARRRPGSKPNEPGWQVRVIPDKNPVLQVYGELNNRGLGIYDMLDGIGAHEIVVEHPQHFKTWPDLTERNLEEVLLVFQERIVDLKRDSRFRYVLVHKNHGEAMGMTHQHSYSHIIATPITPRRVKDELINTRDYYLYKERCIFCDMIRQELKEAERVVLEDGHFIAMTPFASATPFEVWILPEKHETFFEKNPDSQFLASMLKEILAKLQRLLNDPNYIMVFHSGPNLNAKRRRNYWKTLQKDYHWHIEIIPRLRTFTSFELGSGFPINVLPPEKAAKILIAEKWEA